MSNLGPNQTLQAGGTINPSVFVTMSGDFACTQAISGSVPCGISQEGTKFATVSYAAQSGDPIGIYGDSREAFLTLGGTVTTPAFLKPDANGNGITAGSGDKVGAQALQGGTAGSVVRVKVLVDVTN